MPMTLRISKGETGLGMSLFVLSVGREHSERGQGVGNLCRIDLLNSFAASASVGNSERKNDELSGVLHLRREFISLQKSLDPLLVLFIRLDLEFLMAMFSSSVS